MRLETVQKELEFRLAEAETLRNLLDERVKVTEEQAHESRAHSHTTEINTAELETVQRHYTDGMQKLQHLIKEL